jgi:hypothetical protein
MGQVLERGVTSHQAVVSWAKQLLDESAVLLRFGVQKYCAAGDDAGTPHVAS